MECVQFVWVCRQVVRLISHLDQGFIQIVESVLSLAVDGVLMPSGDV